MKKILSCIQPTGDLHFGNYFGAIQNWVRLQSEYDCKYGVVDYHAMTMPYNPKKLRENTWNLVFDLLACGINIETLFIQSAIPEHAELNWIFNCVCSHGELTRMTQFKDKSKQVQEGKKDAMISAGLFIYPVLQAADILIYHADYVPVGKDQEQHLELSRNIAHRFNTQFKKPYFTLPEPLFTEVPKVMSTADPTRKMSKSAGAKHHIKVFGAEKQIRKQIRSAVTDTGENTSGQMSPGVANLFRLLKAAGQQQNHDELMATYEAGTLKYAELKEVVADALVELANDFREKRAELLANKKALKNQIKASTENIRKIAKQTLRDVKEITGLMHAR